MAILYKNSTPYNSAYILKYQDGTFSLDRDIPSVIRSDHDTIRILKPDETLHSIAHEIYGDSGKWYVLAEANNIGNPFTELRPGMKIIIPAYEIIE